MPETLSLQKDESYTGKMLILWGSGYEITSSLAAPVAEGPTCISFSNGIDDAVWSFDYDTESTIAVDGNSIDKVFPNQMIRTTGSLEHVDSNSDATLLRITVGDKRVEANVSNEEADKWEAKEGQDITFTGRVKNLTVNVEDVFQSEYIILEVIVMD